MSFLLVLFELELFVLRTRGWFEVFPLSIYSALFRSKWRRGLGETTWRPVVSKLSSANLILLDRPVEVCLLEKLELVELERLVIII